MKGQTRENEFERVAGAVDGASKVAGQQRVSHLLRSRQEGNLFWGRKNPVKTQDLRE